MSARISELKKKLDEATKPGSIDWGFCIPDCGRCCCKDRGNETTSDETGIIAKRLNIPTEEFISDRHPGTGRMFLKTEGNRCIFLSDRSLCLVYDCKPKVCTKYGYWLSDCRDFRRIRELSGREIRVKARLKDLWMKEREKKSYDRVKWKVMAELLVEEMAGDGERG